MKRAAGRDAEWFRRPLSAIADALSRPQGKFHRTPPARGRGKRPIGKASAARCGGERAADRSRGFGSTGMGRNASPPEGAALRRRRRASRFAPARPGRGEAEGGSEPTRVGRTGPAPSRPSPGDPDVSLSGASVDKTRDGKLLGDILPKRLSDRRRAPKRRRFEEGANVPTAPDPNPRPRLSAARRRALAAPSPRDPNARPPRGGSISDGKADAESPPSSVHAETGAKPFRKESRACEAPPRTRDPPPAHPAKGTRVPGYAPLVPCGASSATTSFSDAAKPANPWISEGMISFVARPLATDLSASYA